MHEGHHGILDNIEEEETHQDHPHPHDHHHDDHGHDHHDHPHKDHKQASSFGKQSSLVEYINEFAYPGLLLIMIVLSAFGSINAALGFHLALIPLTISGGHLFWSTLQATIETKKITAGVLVVIAMAATAYIDDYLAAAIVGWMMIIGESIENLTLERTRNAVRELIKLTPSVATVNREGSWVTVPLREVKPGDIALVRPGDKVPTDGTVVSGSATVNEATITGESLPVEKGKGDKVFAGTVNEFGALEVKVEKIGADTTLGQIIKIVKEAQDNKGQNQRIADRFAAYFTPVILLLSALVYWGSGELIRAVTILVIACPCALVLATPTAVVASVGNAARKAVLIKGGVTLELAGQVTTVLMDKTGTLTTGKPKVVTVKSFTEESENQVLAAAASAEQKSEHPLARAVLTAAREQGLALTAADDFKMEIGRGVTATVNGKMIAVGNRALLSDDAGETVQHFINDCESLGQTVLLVKVAGKLIGAIGISDALRPDAPKTVAAMKAKGIKNITMLTGDNPYAAAAIAKQAGVTGFKAQLLPEDKLKVVKELQGQGEVVAMIGDGVNDGPALVLADVGIAMGAAGTDVAIEAADIALMGDNLEMVPMVLGLSRMALKLIKQNIWFFAVGVNVVGIILSTIGTLTPIMAAIVHNAASVAVVANSARLLTYSGDKNAAAESNKTATSTQA